MSKLSLVVFALLLSFAQGTFPQVRSSDRANETAFDWVTYHRKNDSDWAKRTGLSAAEIRDLRLAAEIADDEPSNPIDSIDAKGLRGQILLVTAAGSGHCLNVAVYRRVSSGFERVWSVAETPDGLGFCHPSLCPNPQAFATKDGEIVVKVPVQHSGAPMGVCNRRLVLSYRRVGDSYKLSTQSVSR